MSKPEGDTGPNTAGAMIQELEYIGNMVRSRSVQNAARIEVLAHENVGLKSGLASALAEIEALKIELKKALGGDTAQAASVPKDA